LQHPHLTDTELTGARSAGMTDMVLFLGTVSAETWKGVDVGYLAYLGAAITCVLGLLALARPLQVATTLGLRPMDGLGVSEVRATYGGLFLAAGATVFVVGYPANVVLGAAWGGAALARLASLAWPQSRQWRNLVGIGFEALLSLLLLAPWGLRAAT